MGEYQFYDFLAIDRPLDQAAQRALRRISTRASITTTRFTNHYEWGDFKGDSLKFMEQWFDLHFYFANWGTRRLTVRLPKRFLTPRDVKRPVGRSAPCRPLRPLVSERRRPPAIRARPAADDRVASASTAAQPAAPQSAGCLRRLSVVCPMAPRKGP